MTKNRELTFMQAVKRNAKDVGILAAVIVGILLVVALILAGVAWEVLKVVAVIKFIAWW